MQTRRIWNQHTYHITNVRADGTIPAVEQNNWLVPGLNNFRLNEFGQFEAPPCDIDNDRDIDRLDIAAIVAGRGQTGGARRRSGRGRDGRITVNDARACALRCTRPRCAS